jgi:hypothetical protein
MKFFSIRENNIIPTTKISMVMAKLVRMFRMSKVPEPKIMPRNVSMIEAMGLTVRLHRHFSGMILAGYTTGVANIHNWMPKPTS